MTRRRKISDHGFTLLELVVVMASLTVMIAISMNSFAHYMTDAHNAVASQTMKFVGKAFEAGVVEGSGGALPIADFIETEEQFNSSPFKPILPGFIYSDKTKLQMIYDPTCTTANCTQRVIFVSACKGDRLSGTMVLGNGLEIITNFNIGKVAC